MGARHVPVLVEETLEVLAVRSGGFYVDGTLGLGGHARRVLEGSGPDGRLLGVDRDPQSLALAQEQLAAFAERVRVVQGDFRDLPRVLGDQRADGILLDLGVSSPQLDSPERGFSFQLDGPLDMRMDPSQGLTASDVVNRMPEQELADLIYRLGEDRASRRIARAIVRERSRRHIESTTELASIVRRAAARGRRTRLDPATRTFQALRIYVNRELEGLRSTLHELARCLAPAGRLAVIAFHSLEDREVKHAFRELASEGFRVLTRKPVRPGEDEVRANPRARSSRLRGLEREAA